jgi:hypothetical protein
MRFLLDMSISPKTVDYLKRLGHDAVHLHAEGLDRLPDQVNRYLHGVLSQHRSVLEHGAVVSVSESQIRIRTLPIIANG